MATVLLAQRNAGHAAAATMRGTISRCARQIPITRPIVFRRVDCRRSGISCQEYRLGRAICDLPVRHAPRRRMNPADSTI